MLSHIGSKQRLFGVELMGHLPYSADLPANDLFLFPHNKKQMRGQRFSSPEDAVEAFKNNVLEVSQSEWEKCFDMWFERMCSAGEYFEKQ